MTKLDERRMIGIGRWKGRSFHSIDFLTLELFELAYRRDNDRAYTDIDRKEYRHLVTRALDGSHRPQKVVLYFLFFIACKNPTILYCSLQ